MLLHLFFHIHVIALNKTIIIMLLIKWELDEKKPFRLDF